MKNYEKYHRKASKKFINNIEKFIRKRSKKTSRHMDKKNKINKIK